ncbi:abortive infection system antitoxin AbiGi family protein [Neisseria zalophi]|uniref:DUF2971 domain-containing protein n=1 Tax=Neisseria zalophi TaxID=640030 RepID=A0A5J6PXC7_9NEIS|nr:abortive infection system antitoxin AbiGi family protein [Neisseria zalophi]QEY26856.1 hypothetical protein D0T92_10165 [Neisseria zalophi]
MAIKSNTLFHFTPKEEYLFDLLENGFCPRYCYEDIRWIFNEEFLQELSNTNNDEGFLIKLVKGFTEKTISSIAYPMTCFCDIPLTQITSHTDLYGKFGLGMTKEWGIKNGLNPIFYVSRDSSIPNNIRKYLLDFHNIYSVPLKIINEQESIMPLLNLLPFIKPLKGEMKKSGQTFKKNFDEECEWRYIPPLQKPKFESFIPNLPLIEKSLEEENALTKKYASLAFQPNDVKYIFVPSDKEIPNVIKKIHEIFNDKKYEKDEIHLLSSKVISLETITKDI